MRRITKKISSCILFLGESFDLMDGVLGMSLSPYRPGRDRYLYFHALASVTENVMFTNILRNDTHIHGSDLDPNDIHVSKHNDVISLR